MRLVAIAGVLAIAARAAAQPVCGICTRGDELVDKLELQPLRSIALAELSLDDPLTPEQYARIVELRRRSPVLGRLGAVDDADLAAIAAALCKSAAGACVDATARALRCLGDRCEVALPPDPRRADALTTSECGQPRSSKRSAPFGVGFEWGTGYHRSRYPNDGRAWSFGIEARLRLPGRFAAVARIDRVAGRDEATDVDDNGEDDVWTGSITRIYALGGPSIVLGRARFEGEPRFLRLDLLGGYVSTRSQADESGPAAGVDLAYQLMVLRFGVRFVQGFGDADEATTLIGHLGFVFGSTPSYASDEDCSGNRIGPRNHPSRLALGMDFPLIGYGISSELGLVVPSLGVEIAWKLTRKLDVLTRGDLLWYPGHDRDRVIHQAVLAGMRIDHAARRRREELGFFTTVMGGYSHGAGFTPTSTGSGPIGDVSLGWGIQSSEATAYFRLHGRFGVSPDNFDYRAIFLSGGFELRLDPRRWRRRS